MRDNVGEERQHWMGVLAKTPLRRLEKEWLRLRSKPEYEFLRKPETGAVMVQGRVGGTGEGFNLGEMTVTRCTVKSSEGSTGSAFVMGRSHRHAELAAVFEDLTEKAAEVEKAGNVDSPFAEITDDDIDNLFS